MTGENKLPEIDNLPIRDRDIYYRQNREETDKVLTWEEKREIGNIILTLLQTNLEKDEFKYYINILRNNPSISNLIGCFIVRLNTEKTTKLLEAIDIELLVEINKYIDINNDNIIDLFLREDIEDIIHLINEYKLEDIRDKGEKHILIKALKKGIAPTLGDEIINLYLELREKIKAIF